MTLSAGYLLSIGAFCPTVSLFSISPLRSTFPTSNFFLCLQVRIVGGLFLSSQRYDSLFSLLLEINNRRKPPWILNHINHSPVSLFFSPFPDSHRQRYVSIMGDKEFSRSPFCKSAQDFTLGIDDAPIALPTEIVFRAAPINRLTLGIMTVNPSKQNLSVLIRQMPCFWSLADACVGRILSPGKVQFKFTNEESVNLVFQCGPWSFNDWMLTIHWWYPNIIEEERKIIFCWGRIRGIPNLYITNAMGRLVGSSIGSVTEVDFEENVNNTVCVRVQMDWNCDNPLVMSSPQDHGNFERLSVIFNKSASQFWSHQFGHYLIETLRLHVNMSKYWRDSFNKSWKDEKERVMIAEIYDRLIVVATNKC